MAVTQEQFDTDLAGLTSSVTTLVAAVDAWVAAHPDVDLTAEDQAVQDASAAVKGELDKLNPAVTPPVVEPPAE